MGNECSSCCTAEMNEEINDQSENKKNTWRQDQNKNRADRQALKASFTSAQKGEKVKDLNIQNDLIKIVQLQALVRGFIQRRRYRVQHAELIKHSGKYFTKEEAEETLGGKYDPNADLETRVYTYKSNATYSGQWKGGLRHGRGTMTWPDGARYEGDWDHNQASGEGKFSHEDGDVYEGQWKNSKANGHGVYTNTTGARYEGAWHNELQHGFGVEVWKDGARYEGSYVMSKKTGRGKYIWTDGSYYDGEWVENQITGQGEYFWKDGRRYHGNWNNNNMHGYGIYFYADGIRYDGQYKNDKKEGYGVYKWVDGREYRGYWHLGKQHGLGIYSDPAKDSVKYGLWENGRRVQWFEADQVEFIKDGRFDITSLFKQSESKKYATANQNFDKPRNFDHQIDELKKLYKIESS